MKYDMPSGFEELFKELRKPQNEPEKPKSGMTTEELIRNMEHNARLVEKGEQK